MAFEFENPSASVSQLEAQLRELEGLANSFGLAMTTALRQSIVDGRRLEDVLRSLALSLSSRALSQALAPIGEGIGSVLSRGLGGLLPHAPLGEHASLGSGIPGGAAGPGALSGRGSRGLNVVFNVTTPDAQSFRRSEGEVAAMLARAVGRGQRGL
jgi:hypothetical protein